jgi:hypothetical protein
MSDDDDDDDEDDIDDDDDKYDNFYLQFIAQGTGGSVVNMSSVASSIKGNTCIAK